MMEFLELSNSKEIEMAIMNGSKILVTAHVSPDGDSIGSMVAFSHGIKEILGVGSEVDYILQDKLPTNLRFLNKDNFIKEYNPALTYKDYDLVIFLDCGSRDRPGKIRNLITEETLIVNIDHHQSNDEYGNFNLVDVRASSTCEVLFGFFKELEIKITKEMAQGLYVGLVNDTGNFCHSNTTAEVFSIASELVKAGANPNYLVKELFQKQSLIRMRVVGKILNNFTVVPEHKLVYFYISDEVIEELNLGKNDVNGIVEMLLNYEEASVALLLKQDGDAIKGSLRSKHDIDVNKVANIFGGGGHIKAAGFKTELTKDEILEKIIEKLN